MKRLFSFLAVVFAVGPHTMVLDAEAATRMGSGKSMGAQRQVTPDKAPGAATPATAVTPAAGAAAPSRSWMGPVAGLAAGLGIAALVSHLGFGDAQASMVMMGLLAAAIMVVVGIFMRKRAAAHKSTVIGQGRLHYAHANPVMSRNANYWPEPNAQAYKFLMPAGNGSTASRIPADFDTAGFERNAKVNFIRLQAANDLGDLDDIRQFTTPEMFAELKMELADRGTAIQKTDVVSINANVIDLEENTNRYVVSVRFTGAIRDTGNAQYERFDEVWYITKTRQDSGGWVLSGIQ